MALIECFECGNQVSDAAITCPKCGISIAATLKQTNKSSSTENEEKPTGLIRKFRGAKLSTQVLLTILMWAVAGILIYTVKAESAALKNTIFVVIGIASLVRGWQSASAMIKREEDRMSQIDIIAAGINRAKSLDGGAIGYLLLALIYAGFWAIAYLVMASTSVVLAPIMTIFVAYKIYKVKTK